MPTGRSGCPEETCRKSRLDFGVSGATFADAIDINGPGGGGTPRGLAPKKTPSMRDRVSQSILGSEEIGGH